VGGRAARCVADVRIERPAVVGDLPLAVGELDRPGQGLLYARAGGRLSLGREDRPRAKAARDLDAAVLVAAVAAVDVEREALAVDEDFAVVSLSQLDRWLARAGGAGYGEGKNSGAG